MPMDLTDDARAPHFCAAILRNNGGASVKRARPTGFAAVFSGASPSPPGLHCRSIYSARTGKTAGTPVNKMPPRCGKSAAFDLLNSIFFVGCVQILWS
jgi:hypothetical protein